MTKSGKIGNLNHCRFFPDRYDFEVATDKKKQFKIVAELLKQANTIGNR